MCFLSCCCCCCFFFTSVRLTLELLAINVEKHLRWSLHTRLLFVFTEKNISLFGEDNFRFNQSINFKNQNSLDTSLSLQYFTKYLRLIIVLINVLIMPPALLFCGAKMKNENKRKKWKSLKEKTIKKLSPRSKCHCFSNVYCFVLERLEFKYFSVFHGLSTLKSISPALPNLAYVQHSTERLLVWSARWVIFSRAFITCNDFVF